MGAGFCNFRSLSRMAHRSNRPELVALKECLDDHDDHIDLLYLTDSEASLLAIRKWVGGGAKLNQA